jgi:hypothetical protein
MTPEQKHILIHAVGNMKGYRNYFATAPDCDNYEDVQELVKAGFMDLIPGTLDESPGLECYRVTASGFKTLP